jgi:hypothetical protein
MSGGEVGSPIWARIWVMGSESVRNAMNVRGVWQEGRLAGGASGRRGVWQEGRLAGGADEGEDLVDPCEQSCPLGRPGGGGIRCLQFSPLGLGRRGRWSLGKGGMWADGLSGEGVVLQRPGCDEGLQELGCKGRGLVEAEARFRVGWIGVRLKLDPLEEPVGDTQVKMKVGVQGRAEAVQEAHGPEGVGSDLARLTIRNGRKYIPTWTKEFPHWPRKKP